MMDTPRWIVAELDRLAAESLRRERRVVTRLGEGWCLVDGRRLQNFAGNDYLNLAEDPRVAEAAGNALTAAGLGAGASALVSGRTNWHVALEKRIARFEREPAAILFPTGYAANVGAIGALVGAGDTVFCDRLNHASLVDGCRLSGARLRVYRHDRLERLLQELEKPAGDGRRLIVTDGVFSMDGDVAPLPELCRLAENYGAMLLVDEAHGTGVFGATGRGVCEHFSLESSVTVRVGTLSKAVGALGGFVAGSQELIDWLWNRSRTQIYSTALPAAVCAGALAAIDLIEQEPARRERLHRNAAHLRKSLSERNVPVASGACGPIIPVILNEPALAVRAALKLEAAGFLVGAIRPPTVPRGTSRLRITVSAVHTPQDVETLANQIASVLRQTD